MDKQDKTITSNRPARLVSDIKPRPVKRTAVVDLVRPPRKARPQVLDLRKPQPSAKTKRVGGRSINSIAEPKAAATNQATIAKSAKSEKTTTKSVDKIPTASTDTKAKKSAVASNKSSGRSSANFANMRKRIDKASSTISKHMHKFIVNRWDHIKLIRGNVASWLAAMLILMGASLAQMIWYNSQTTTSAAARGGTYIEGVVDKLTTISPLYATTDTEKAASQLVYPGLLSYDETSNLRGDLATSWSSDTTGRLWTVKLKPGLKWSDGRPLTADDVVFTVGLMKNAQISQILHNSWKTITAEAKSASEIQFKLENAYMSFPTALTFGVLPKHTLNDKTPVQISSLFSANTSVPGAGPFKLAKVETINNQSIWHFIPNDYYHDYRPNLNELAIRTYADQSSMINGLKRGEVNAISNVKISDLKQFAGDNNYKVIQLKSSDGIYALFNNDSSIMTGQVKNALRLAVNRNSLRQSITEGNKVLSTPTSLETPIATGVYTSVDQLKQPDYNKQLATQTLEQAGWKLVPGSSLRQKNGQTLDISVVTIKGTNYSKIAGQIVDQWKSIGVNAKLTMVEPNEAQQNYLMPRSFDVLVYQMHLGSDADEYAYWSSTQTGETGLNFANYTSRRAEIALSAGRTNPNAQAREARYIAFVEQWLKDTPAIALYQPNYYYVTARDISSLHDGNSLIDAANRFRSTNDWTVGNATVRNTP